MNCTLKALLVALCAMVVLVAPNWAAAQDATTEADASIEIVAPPSDYEETVRLPGDPDMVNGGFHIYSLNEVLREGPQTERTGVVARCLHQAVAERADRTPVEIACSCACAGRPDHIRTCIRMGVPRQFPGIGFTASCESAIVAFGTRQASALSLEAERLRAENSRLAAEGSPSRPAQLQIDTLRGTIADLQRELASRTQERDNARTELASLPSEEQAPPARPRGRRTLAQHPRRVTTPVVRTPRASSVLPVVARSVARAAGASAPVTRHVVRSPLYHTNASIACADHPVMHNGLNSLYCETGVDSHVTDLLSKVPVATRVHHIALPLTVLTPARDVHVHAIYTSMTPSDQQALNTLLVTNPIRMGMKSWDPTHNAYIRRRFPRGPGTVDDRLIAFHASVPARAGSTQFYIPDHTGYWIPIENATSSVAIPAPSASAPPPPAPPAVAALPPAGPSAPPVVAALASGASTLPPPPIGSSPSAPATPPPAGGPSASVGLLPGFNPNLIALTPGMNQPLPADHPEARKHFGWVLAGIIVLALACLAVGILWSRSVTKHHAVETERNSVPHARERIKSFGVGDSIFPPPNPKTGAEPASGDAPTVVLAFSPDAKNPFTGGPAVSHVIGIKLQSEEATVLGVPPPPEPSAAPAPPAAIPPATGITLTGPGSSAPSNKSN